MNIYIQVNGGLGKNLSLTGVIPELKQKYDKVYISSPYYDVFQCCPDVDGVYNPNQIRDFIFDAKAEDAKLVIDRMYDMQDFIYKKLSYADAWRILCGIELKGETGGSDVKVNIDPLRAYPMLASKKVEIIKAIKDAGFKKFAIMQFTGGQTPLQNVPNGDWSKVPYDYQNEPLKRHYPIDKAQKFVDLYAAQHPDTAIVLYQLPNEPKPEGKFIVTAVVPYMVYNLLAKDDMCKEIVTIDSSLQHLTAGLVKTTVIWGHSLPTSFGYPYNNNIIQKCRRDEIVYFGALGPSGARVEYIEPEELLKETNK